MPTKKVLGNLDIYCPNFDHHLQLKLEHITPEQVAALDDTVQYKIFQYKEKVIGYLKWTEKLHINSIAFGCPVVICSFDEEKGISPILFNETVKAQLGHIKNSKLLDDLIGNTVFIQGDRQVMESLLYMNYVETSDIYNLIRMNDPREKSKRELELNTKQNALKSVVDSFLKYERNKKKVLMQFKLNQPKLYGLLFFYEGQKLCKDFYDRAFKYSYISSRPQLSRALAEMYRAGLLSKRGTTRELKYSITSKGIDLLIKVLNKLLYDV